MGLKIELKLEDKQKFQFSCIYIVLVHNIITLYIIINFNKTQRLKINICTNFQQ